MTLQNIMDGASVFGLGIAIAALFVIVAVIYFGGIIIYIWGKLNE